MKNRAKGESYKYAFERIKLSLEKEFSLEAICLIESILSDRLLSNAIGGNEGNSKKVVEASFFDLIKLFQAYGEKNDDDEARALGCALDNWRRGRNTLVHAAVKSFPMTAPKKPPAEFQYEAGRVAKEGGALARRLLRWHRKELQRFHVRP